MRKIAIVVFAFVSLLILMMSWQPSSAAAAGYGYGLGSSYKVLSPIQSGNLTVFPVVAATTYDTSGFLTLDEGLRSGDVIVTEAGMAQGLIRDPRVRPHIQHGGGEVNRLVLINRGDKPLILLAGEIVTGGKQDRVIGKDRIVPAHSDPIDLSVFCVEPGRWVERTATFGTVNAPMAQPSVRAKAMADKDQGQVWAEVRKSQQMAVETAPAAARAAIAGSTSYATVMSTDEVKQRVDSVARPIDQKMHDIIGQLRQRNAVGVVVAVNGEIVWADVFASTALLEKYWPKLIRSYAAEAWITRASGEKADISEAEQFLDDMSGTRETVESEPGVFRHTEIAGSNFRAFELTSLVPKTGFDVHVAKMAENPVALIGPKPKPPQPIYPRD
jgi:hypothetical protein